MEGTETRRDVRYDNTVLPVSNVKVSGTAVVKEGQLYGTADYVTVTVDDETSIRFKLHQRNSPDPAYNVILGDFTTMVASVDGWVMGVDIAAIIEEFKNFVMTDVAQAK